jgi:hypothetical protein
LSGSTEPAIVVSSHPSAACKSHRQCSGQAMAPASSHLVNRHSPLPSQASSAAHGVVGQAGPQVEVGQLKELSLPGGQHACPPGQSALVEQTTAMHGATIIGRGSGAPTTAQR